MLILSELTFFIEQVLDLPRIFSTSIAVGLGPIPSLEETYILPWFRLMLYENRVVSVLKELEAST
jgi:hypothetical protein